MKLFSGPTMAPSRVRTFLLRYLLPVMAAVIVAPLCLVRRAWPAVRQLILATALVCMAAVVASLLAQGF